MKAILTAATIIALTVTPAASAPAQRVRTGGKVSMSWYEGAYGGCGVKLTGRYAAASAGSGLHCGDRIVLVHNGHQTNVIIKDQCPGCGKNGLDVNPHVFELLGVSPSQGVMTAKVKDIR